VLKNKYIKDYLTVLRIDRIALTHQRCRVSEWIVVKLFC